MDLDEEKLVLEAQAGDPHAFEKLLRRYEKPIFCHIFRLLHDEQQSYDALQETYLAVVRSIRHLRDRRCFRAWLYGVATRTCLKSRRRVARRHEVRGLEIESEDLHPLPDSLASSHEEMQQLLEKILVLSPKLRSVILLHFIEGLSLKEVAQGLEISLGTVKSRLAAGLAKLRSVEESTS